MPGAVPGGTVTVSVVATEVPLLMNKPEGEALSHSIGMLPYCILATGLMYCMKAFEFNTSIFTLIEA
jgi:hypothetical protein